MQATSGVYTWSENQKIEYPELQKVIDKHYDSKAVRLDVYVADDKGTVYNVELQATRQKYLPKRIRYYGGLIDLNIIEKGKDYEALNKSYVIFICTYDPFGEGRYIYTFENCCLENTDIRLGDEAVKVVVNTEGMVGEISEELKDTLRFIAGKAPKTAYAKELEKAVDEVKKSEKWRVLDVQWTSVQHGPEWNGERVYDVTDERQGKAKTWRIY